jgi:hypothetical protein
VNDPIGNSDWQTIVGYRNSPGVDATAMANRQALLEAFDALPAGDYAPYWALNSLTFRLQPFKARALRDVRQSRHSPCADQRARKHAPS